MPLKTSTSLRSRLYAYLRMVATAAAPQLKSSCWRTTSTYFCSMTEVVWGKIAAPPGRIPPIATPCCEGPLLAQPTKAAIRPKAPTLQQNSARHIGLSNVICLLPSSRPDGGVKDRVAPQLRRIPDPTVDEI